MTAEFGQTDFLRVFAAREKQVFRAPRINTMSAPVVQSMANGHKVFLFVAGAHGEPPTLAATSQVSLKALAVVSPVINAALVTHNKSTNLPVNNVILPPGDLRGYKELINWIGDVITNGRFVSLRDLRNRPIMCFFNMIHIANKLRINYLAAGLRRRIQEIVMPRNNVQFTLHPGDIRDALTMLSRGHWVRDGIVRGITVADKEGILHPNFEGVLQELYIEFEGLQEEVELRKSEMH